MTNHQDKELSGEPTLQQVVAFLLGEGVLDGMGFGDSDTANPKPRYWWRKHLRAAFATSPQLPVAEQPAGQAVPLLDQIKHSLFVRATDEQVNEWAHRHDLFNALNRDPRAAFEDAQTLAAPRSPVAQMSGDAERWEAVIQLSHKLDDAAQGIYEQQVYDFATEFRVLAGLDGIDSANEAIKRHASETASKPSNAVKTQGWAYPNLSSHTGAVEDMQTLLIPLQDWHAVCQSVADIEAATVPQVANVPSELTDEFLRTAIAFAEAHIDCDVVDGWGELASDGEVERADAEYNRTKAAMIEAYRMAQVSGSSDAAAVQPVVQVSMSEQIINMFEDIASTQNDAGRHAILSAAKHVRALLTTASNAGNAAPAASSIDYQQRQGAHRDIIAEAIAAYDQFMLDDDYDAVGALNRIIGRMRERSALYAAPAAIDVRDAALDLLYVSMELSGVISEYRSMPCDSLEARMFETLDRYAPRINKAKAILQSPPQTGKEVES